jgi:hypothetical protein
MLDETINRYVEYRAVNGFDGAQLCTLDGEEVLAYRLVRVEMSEYGPRISGIPDWLTITMNKDVEIVREKDVNRGHYELVEDPKFRRMNVASDIEGYKKHLARPDDYHSYYDDMTILQWSTHMTADIVYSENRTVETEKSSIESCIQAEMVRKYFPNGFYYPL